MTVVIAADDLQMTQFGVMGAAKYFPVNDNADADAGPDRDVDDVLGGPARCEIFPQRRDADVGIQIDRDAEALGAIAIYVELTPLFLRRFRYQAVIGIVLVKNNRTESAETNGF